MLSIRRIRKFVLSGLIATAASSSAAYAHATLETPVATIGASYKAVVRIGHGCEKSPTIRLTVLVPDGVVSVKPMPKPGWTLETKRGQFGQVFETAQGRKVSEGIKEITWSGNKLADDHYDEFVAALVIAANLPAGERLHFPVVQTCESGENRWVEIAAAGQDAHALKSPAPFVQLVAGKSTAEATRRYTLADLVIDAPWTRATPPGAKVAGGYLKITNGGKTADRLIGGTLPGAERIEVHEMAMADGVMRMRHLTKGLEIAPGETVQLQPGGYHVMFIGLTAPLAVGQPIKGTLVFEKAGTIEVDYTVAPVGAAAPGGHGHH